ncbi:MAG: toxin-antitoxin system HicB family antitoxin [Armatimonadetes bacterium]|nr:toxin-antitoxin system HicB family antitoxin [Armatimonadota bacterium]
MPQHALSIRLPEALFEQASNLARQRRLSLNSLVQEQLQQAINADLEMRLYAAAELLGEHAEEADVSFAEDAQAELALAVRFDA